MPRDKENFNASMRIPKRKQRQKHKQIDDEIKAELMLDKHFYTILRNAWEKGPFAFMEKLDDMKSRACVMINEDLKASEDGTE